MAAGTLGAMVLFLVASSPPAQTGGRLELGHAVDYNAVEFADLVVHPERTGGGSPSRPSRAHDDAVARMRAPKEHFNVASGTGTMQAANRGGAPFPDPAGAAMARTTMEAVEAEANASGGWQPVRPACHPECSCDEISAHWGAFHDAMDFFATPDDMVKRWLALKCKSNPKWLKTRLDLPRFTQTSTQAPPSGDTGVCYFVKVRGENPHADPTEAKAGRAVPLAGWAAAVANRTWFVEDGHVGAAAGSTVDMGTMTIKLAIPHPTSALDLSKKTMALFDFVSQTHDAFWGQLGCRWFAHVDDDTWVNTALVERRLGCLDHDSELYLGYDVGVCFGGFYAMSRAVIRQTAGFLATWWRRRRGRPLTMKMDEFNWGHMLKMHGVMVSSMVHLEHYLLDPGRCKNKAIKGGYNNTCALDWIRAQMLVPHATDPRDDQGGFPVQLKQDAQGASRCLLFIHGFKTAVAMRAAHAAMSVIMNHHPPIDYRLPSWKQLPVADPLCVGGIRSGAGSTDVEHLFRACARRTLDVANATSVL